MSAVRATSTRAVVTPRPTGVLFLCHGLPDPPRPARDIDVQDGFRDDGPPDSTSAPGSSAAADPAPVLGVPADVPHLAQLLFGPVARGTVVGVSTAPSGGSR